MPNAAAKELSVGMIDPLVLGRGKRIFHDDSRLMALRLVKSQVTTTGAILASYAKTEL